MMKIGILSVVSAMVIGISNISAQVGPITGKEWSDPSVGSVGRIEGRNEFIGYDVRDAAEKGNREGTEYYVPLPMEYSAMGNDHIYSVGLDIPFMWVDRDIFLHVEGFPAFYLEINGKQAAYSQDSRAPSEFYVSPRLIDGLNKVVIRVPSGSVAEKLEASLSPALNEQGEPYYNVFLYSQPKVRIEDYAVVTTPDSSGSHMVFDLDVVVSNSYFSTENFMVGFDVYSPDGRLQTYDIREVRVKGQSRDTVSFRELVYHSMKNVWTTDKPNLYKIMVYIKRAGRLIEYVPFKAGFGSVGYADGAFTRNGAPVKINAEAYNAAATPKQTQQELTGLKARGVNTVCVGYPQQYWFYDLCDRVGMNVIDRADINFDEGRDNPNVGGTLSNNPLWENSFIERVAAMYYRNRAHTCVIGYSLGGEVGNGYNMQKSYQWLKDTGTDKAVLFMDAAGQWNTDIEQIGIRD